MFKVGHITHFYNKIGVAIVELDGTISLGDKVKFVRDDRDLFEQTISSIQVEHEKKDSAGRGEIVGIKTDKEVKEGAEMFKI